MVPRRGRLPVVLPLVLYRGERPWKTPRELGKLIEDPLPGCEPYVPGFSFLAVRAQQEPRVRLRELDSIMAKVFLMESAGVDELQEACDAYEAMYRGIRDEELRTLLKDWYDCFMDSSEGEFGSLNESEAGAMLGTKLRRYRKKVMAEADKRVSDERVEAEKKALEEKHQMVRTMKERGMEISLIQEITHLTPEEIERM
jgi:hypothetical protein